jgi:hypothetical protein
VLARVGRQSLFDGKSFAVVFDHQQHLLLVVSDDHFGLGRAGMLGDVIDALLRDPIQIDFGLFGEKALELRHLQRKLYAGSEGDPLDHGFECARQSHPVYLIRPQVVGDLPDFLNRLRGKGGDFVKLLPRRGREFFGRQAQ